MKKILVIGLVLSLIVMLVTGCTGQNADPTEAPTSTPAVDSGVKTGLAVITTLANSTEPGEKEGLARTDSVIVAVTVDNSGVIKACAIDSVQTKINFSSAGVVTTPLDTVFMGKQELGEAYGMNKVSGIGKEWNEQADALAAYVVGKTVAEVKGIALSEGKPSDADLSASVTMSIGDYIAGIEKAVANATDMGAKAGDKIGLGLDSTVAGSKDATAEAEGRGQSYANIVMVTVNGEGTITSCIIDAVQGNVAFNTAGKISTDLSAAVMTKNELGDGYGMKKASSIGKEWNEQAAAFAGYVKGKKLEAVKGIAVNAEGVATDAELTSSVTVHVSPFIELIEKAVNNAYN